MRTQDTGTDGVGVFVCPRPKLIHQFIENTYPQTPKCPHRCELPCPYMTIPCPMYRLSCDPKILFVKPECGLEEVKSCTTIRHTTKSGYPPNARPRHDIFLCEPLVPHVYRLKQNRIMPLRPRLSHADVRGAIEHPNRWWLHNDYAVSRHPCPPVFIHDGGYCADEHMCSSTSL